MATDIQALIGNLTTFYDFAGKNVIHVGAGGGQIIGYAKEAASVLAVDSDSDAVAQLRESVTEQGLADLFEIVHGEFGSVNKPADVVFFEFCLHEMPDPALMLAHGLELAPQVLVIDHDRDSPWSWHACETEKVELSWPAVEKLQVDKSQSYRTTQVFDNHTQLVEKIACMGQQAIDRAAWFEGKTNITIPMVYRIALVTGG